jgi:hypothetical protein
MRFQSLWFRFAASEACRTRDFHDVGEAHAPVLEFDRAIVAAGDLNSLRRLPQHPVEHLDRGAEANADLDVGCERVVDHDLGLLESLRQPLDRQAEVVVDRWDS